MCPTHVNMPLPSVRFEKMHGLGNDFMLIDARLQQFRLDPAIIRYWADRRTGVGFDQLIVLDDTPESGFIAAYRFYNADGSEAEQCGNGQRCLGRYLWQSGWAREPTFHVIGPGGAVTITVHAEDDIEISLPKPECYLSEAGDYAEVSVGNPHRVQWMEAIDDQDLAALAASVRREYPDGINLEVVQRLAPDHLKIRIDERGVGETRACGTGAAAAAVATVQRFSGTDSGKTVKHHVQVDMPGGQLQVNCQPASGKLSVRGPAAHVYQGRAFYPPSATSTEYHER